MRTILIGALLLGGCATNGVTGPGGALLDVEWRVQSVGDSAVREGSRITMTFRTDGNVGGRSGCNSFFAPYTIDGTTISIGPVGGTLMACADPLMAQEHRFLQLLEKSSQFTLRDGPTLTLTAASGERITARR